MERYSLSMRFGPPGRTATLEKNVHHRRFRRTPYRIIPEASWKQALSRWISRRGSPAGNHTKEALGTVPRFYLIRSMRSLTG